MNRILAIAMLTVSMCLIASAQAIELSDDVTLNGFGTFGLTKTTDSEFGYRSGLSNDSPVYQNWDAQSRNIFGLQLNARFNDKLTSTLQVVHQEQYENGLDRHIRIAALNYQLTPDWQVRVGRVSPKGSTFTDARSVSYGYLWTNIPMEYDGQIITKAYDGIEVNYTHQYETATSHTSLGIGKSSMFSGANDTYEKLEFNPIIGLNHEIEFNDYTFRAGISGIKSKSQWLPSLIQGWQQVSTYFPDDAKNALDLLDTEGAMFWVYALGASYDNGDWVIQSEAIKFQSSSGLYHSITSAYLSVGHRFGQFTPYALVSLFDSKSSDFTPSSGYQMAANYSNDLSLLSQGTDLVLRDMKQKGLGLGVRWDLNEHFALKAQWDRKFVSNVINGMWWKVGLIDGDKTIDIFTINLDYVF